jgi:hypothetical protein
LLSPPHQLGYHQWEPDQQSYAPIPTKTTKGERISRKLKMESTNNKRVIKKVLSKTTHNRGRIISIIFRNYVGNNGHLLQNLPQVFQYLFFSQLKGRNHLRWVLSPRILKSEMLPLLQELNSVTHVASNDPKTGQTLLLQSLDSLKKWLDGLKLIACQGVLLPTIINQGTRTGMKSKGRNHVRSIKPLRTPVPNKIIIKKRAFFP